MPPLKCAPTLALPLTTLLTKPHALTNSNPNLSWINPGNSNDANANPNPKHVTPTPAPATLPLTVLTPFLTLT